MGSFGIINRTVTADYRGAPLLGRKKLGTGTRRGRREKKPLRSCRVSETGAGSALGSGWWEGAAGRTCRSSARGSPGRRSEGPCWRLAAAGRSRGAGGPQRSPSQRAQGGCTPHSGLPPRAKGPVLPRDSGREPEPLCLHSPGAPAAGECLGPSAPPGCEARLGACSAPPSHPTPRPQLFRPLEGR